MKVFGFWNLLMLFLTSLFWSTNSYGKNEQMLLKGAVVYSLVNGLSGSTVKIA